MGAAGSSPGPPSLSLADRLATACFTGDTPSVHAAIAAGASVNGKGRAPRWTYSRLPLYAAVAGKHHDVVVLLLQHGADANGDNVMSAAVCLSTPEILQLLIDVGGDVNQRCVDQPVLFWAVDNYQPPLMAVLLAEPTLNLAVTYKGKTPEQYARSFVLDRVALADILAREVRTAVATLECACCC